MQWVIVIGFNSCFAGTCRRRKVIPLRDKKIHSRMRKKYTQAKHGVSIPQPPIEKCEDLMTIYLAGRVV
jgi:hypothetical protein